MSKFDTKIQSLKVKVLREVARDYWTGKLSQTILDIPKRIIPGKVPTMRCCVYKERAVVEERIKEAMGGNPDNPNVVEVIDIACDECPIGGYEVTPSCRGCLAHPCKHVCKFGALTLDKNHVAHIDKSKCKECGSCAKVCPFSAIYHYIRPCQSACKAGALSMGEDNQAHIDNDKCISCGACVYYCPFGAITDKSFILDVVQLLKDRKDNPDRKVIAVVAPSIASQFTHAKIGQVFTGLYTLGFDSIVEAALGADIVTKSETEELSKKGFLTSSCCPAFVTYIKKNFPELVEYISSNDSPMVATAKLLKAEDPTCKVVFIGPCIAKKAESRKEEVKPFVDVAITFEELQALFDSRDITVTSLRESTLSDASYYGRIFGRIGGLTEAVGHQLSLLGSDFTVAPRICNGIEEYKVALLQKKLGKADFNFIEGMTCVGGCVNGAGNLTHAKTNVNLINAFAEKQKEETI